MLGDKFLTEEGVVNTGDVLDSREDDVSEELLVQVIFPGLV